jgi:hypothetical protein
MPRKTVSKNRAMGPLPVRTARGAGRRLRLAAPLPPRRAAGFRVGFFFLLDAVLLCFRVLRARVVEDRSEDPALLREPGGEDVRVATSTP